jgi:hypothetical protein
VVTLNITGPKGKDQKFTMTKDFVFGAGTGGPPHVQIPFEIDAAALGIAAEPGKKPELEEGEWKFQATIPKDRREIFDPKEHKSDEATVRVVKRPLRVLLFAGGPTRDYQFVRNMMVREADHGRVDLSICLQGARDGVVQDVTPDRFLKHFPSALGGEVTDKAEDRYYNLSNYDLIMAFDPDWSRSEQPGEVSPEALVNLEKWVYLHAGGLIEVAGPVYTYQLANPANKEQVRPMLNMLPVKLRDARLDIDRPTTDPFRLHFPGATAEMEFLKLDEESKENMSGWEEFFTGKPKSESSPDLPVLRGFYSYYPLEDVKPSATVVATYGDPRAQMKDTKEMPFLVTMPYGSGKVVYLGSGEMWRLRQYREVYNERFWTKLARYAGSGNLTRLNKRGDLVMGQKFTAGQMIHMEAQLLGRDLRPLSDREEPKVLFKAPTGVTMPNVNLKAKPHSPSDWNGWFEANFRVTAPGEYKLDLPIPEGGETLTKKFSVREANPELDDTKPDFGQMYQLASDVTEVLPRIKEKKDQEELVQALESTAAKLLQQGVIERGPAADKPAAGKDKGEVKDAGAEKEPPRLFFDLSTARLIPKCMVTDSKTQRSRGPVKDFWDMGFTISENPQLQLAYVLLLVAFLLSVEWLTRKLLKLA